MKLSTLFNTSLLILFLCLANLAICQAQTVAHANLGKSTKGIQLIDDENINITSIYADADGSSVYSLTLGQDIPEKVSIHFKDATGNMSISHTFSKLPKGFEYPLYLTGFPPGIYKVEIVTTSQTIRKQIQKKR